MTAQMFGQPLGGTMQHSIPMVGQRQVVGTSPVPLAVVNGREDRIINLDYVDSVAYANLWEGRCHRLNGLGHVPFWEAPARFNPVLNRFLLDVDTGRAALRHPKGAE